MKPNATEYKPDPHYLRELIERAGISQLEAARQIGVSPRAMRHYLCVSADAKRNDAPYPVQFCLEALADAAGVEGDK